MPHETRQGRKVRSQLRHQRTTRLKYLRVTLVGQELSPTSSARARHKHHDAGSERKSVKEGRRRRRAEEREERKINTENKREQESGWRGGGGKRGTKRVNNR